MFFLPDYKHDAFVPELEDNTVQLDPENTQADREAREEAETEQARDATAKAIPSSPTQPPVVVPKTQLGHLSFICSAVQRIKVGLASLAKDQVSLSKVVEDKVHNINNIIDELVVEVKELRSFFMSEEKIASEEATDGEETIEQYVVQPRTIAQRSAAIPIVTNPLVILATSSTTTHAEDDGFISTPSVQTDNVNAKSSSPLPIDRAQS